MVCSTVTPCSKKLFDKYSKIFDYFIILSQNGFQQWCARTIAWELTTRGAAVGDPFLQASPECLAISPHYHLTLAARSCQMVCFRVSIFGWAIALPCTCNTPQVPWSSEFIGKEHCCKTTICQHAAMIPQRKRWPARAHHPVRKVSFNKNM